VSQLREQGATEADLGGFQDLHASALVSLAVNANVRLLDPEKARRYYERAYDIRKDEFMRALLACYRARSGAEAEARALLRTIRPGPGTWYNLACTHALLGDVDEALDYLRTDIELNHASEESRDRQREWAAEDPDLEALRDDPRFRRLVRTD
ncbi:MAG: tetratricopeptide repeat protein, partial [Planctomycetota bacterium]